MVVVVAVAAAGCVGKREKGSDSLRDAADSATRTVIILFFVGFN
jgi:hypothetical protein